MGHACNLERHLAFQGGGKGGDQNQKHREGYLLFSQKEKGRLSMAGQVVVTGNLIGQADGSWQLVRTEEGVHRHGGCDAV